MKKKIIIIVLIVTNLISLFFLINEFSYRGQNVRFGIDMAQRCLSSDIIDILENDMYTSTDLYLLIEMNDMGKFWLTHPYSKNKHMKNMLETLDQIKSQLKDLRSMVEQGEESNLIEAKKKEITETAKKFKEDGEKLDDKFKNNNLLWYYYFNF